MQKTLNRNEGLQRSITNLVILIASYGMLALTIFLYNNGEIGADGILICTIAMMGSFGSATALASLSNNLNQTLASGERVLSILEEKPVVEEIPENGMTLDNSEFTGARADHVTFSYDDEVILKDYSIELQSGKITGIHGASGSGKSTLLKLLMRFWNINQGNIEVSGENVNKIPTKHLREIESYVTQETHLFHDSIANNIAIGKMNATREEIMEAAKKASIHDFIMTLPNGYDTKVGELGDTLSGGEKQRIGIARAFLHDAPFILLDEPTSNLDSLNEGIILKSLKESSEKKTIVLVSHRTSTMNVADVIYEMENGRVS
jgi:ATP-binding cassette subfamily C protein